MSGEETSLRELFNKAKAKVDSLENLNPQSEELKQEWQSAVKALEDCRSLIDQLGLFSRNEDLDDVSTQDIQYLSIDYLLAEIIAKSYSKDRKAQLQTVSEYLERFLTRVDDYDMLNDKDKKLFSQYRDDRSKFALVSSTNPQQRRNIKVMRFREEKSLKEKLKMLREQSQMINVDDETLDLLSQELSILASMPPPEPSNSTDQADTDNRQHGRSGDGYSERLDGPVNIGGLGRRGGPLLDSQGKPLQPFTLTDRRTEMQQGVFRPSHNLPTMSIDEYLEEERRRGGIIEGGGNANAAQPEPDEDNIDAQDEATMKAREWDEFVEANPKGVGNRLNRG